MSTSKHIERICIAAVIVALLISILFANGAALGIQVQVASVSYADKLFDTAKVHTIDIIIDDWDAFLQTAQSEEYTVCSVVIDGESFANVGIRGKGNTSLSTVSSMDSSRYSFKIEFDQYDSSNTYYGLDKLSLNNLIQDNTMMKDYLTYQMMREFGVAAPLCSYVYITVNGEDWGLYLAVEAVEESFLQRNYGNDYGDLYKPDSLGLGGGRGNGQDFDLESFMESSDEDSTSGNTIPSMPDNGTWPGSGSDASEIPGMPGGLDFSQMEGMMPGDFDASQMFGDMGGFGMGSGETKLQYTDDNPSSYSTIFSSAKTPVTAADKSRLIAALKDLSEGKESAVDVDSVIRYFVVHNFVVNADSYTGTMVHNYYLYEDDGQLSMIPWDYNLAFGTFLGSNASSAVNDDIDSPLSVTGNDRPMIDWIYSSEEYTELYHQYFQEFLDTVDVQAIITRTKVLIAPYVEKDPTKFCTYEEFETGVETLARFCDLRSQSVAQQLAGEEANVDASAIDLSAMGTMGGGFGGNNSPSDTAGYTKEDNTNPSSGGFQQFPGFGAQGGMTPPDGMDIPEGMGMPEGMENTFSDQNRNAQGNSPGTGENGFTALQGTSSWLLLAAAVAVLIGGLVFAFKFKR